MPFAPVEEKVRFEFGQIEGTVLLPQGDQGIQIEIRFAGALRDDGGKTGHRASGEGIDIHRDSLLRFPVQGKKLNDAVFRFVQKTAGQFKFESAAHGVCGESGAAAAEEDSLFHGAGDDQGNVFSISGPVQEFPAGFRRIGRIHRHGVVLLQTESAGGFPETAALRPFLAEEQNAELFHS